MMIFFFTYCKKSFYSQRVAFRFSSRGLNVIRRLIFSIIHQDKHPFYYFGNKVSRFCLELTSWLSWLAMSLDFSSAWTPILTILDLLYMDDDNGNQGLVLLHQTCC